jgi:tetratricopeptide (TPR) repeat protein
LALGQCFQQIRQYRLAMSHYESAIEEIPDREAENKKRALYAAGRLAMAMKNFDTAEKHLTVLAGLDFSYRDVWPMLEKIAKVRDRSPSVLAQGGDGASGGGAL